MATLTKFNALTENIAEKVHNFETDAIKVLLTNTAPVVTNSVIANITDITAGNGYTAGGSVASIVSSAQTSGVYKLVVNDVIFTASGGSIGPFRYVVVYNSTAVNGPLMFFGDYGSVITLNIGETLTVDFDQVNGILTIG